MPKLPPPPRMQYVLAINDPAPNQGVGPHNRLPEAQKPTRRSRLCATRIAESCDDGPVPVAAVAGLAEQFQPAVRVVVKLGGQHPAFEYLLLVRRAVAVDHHEGIS